MDLEEIIVEICDDAGLGQNPTTHRTRIIRKLRVTLEEMDAMVMWRCAIIPFSKSVPVNKNKVSVSSVDLFKPIICKFVDSNSVEHPLTYREITNFETEHANYGTATNNFPTIYTIGGGNIFVGPGVMVDRTVITGKVRRRLTENDVEQLPAPMIIDGTVRKMGTTPEIRTSARISWFTMKKTIIAAASKHTSEERDTQPLDPMIVRNQRYISTLRS